MKKRERMRIRIAGRCAHEKLRLETSEATPYCLRKIPEHLRQDPAILEAAAKHKAATIEKTWSGELLSRKPDLCAYLDGLSVWDWPTFDQLHYERYFHHRRSVDISGQPVVHDPLLPPSPWIGYKWLPEHLQQVGAGIG